MKLLQLVLNIIWLFTAGIWLFLSYVLAGVVACLLIVTIPFGLASFRIAGYVLWPFGREVVDTGRGISRWASRFPSTRLAVQGRALATAVESR